MQVRFLGLKLLISFCGYSVANSFGGSCFTEGMFQRGKHIRFTSLLYNCVTHLFLAERGLKKLTGVLQVLIFLSCSRRGNCH